MTVILPPHDSWTRIATSLSADGRFLASVSWFISHHNENRQQFYLVPSLVDVVFSRVYVAVLLDAYSRRMIGWVVERTMGTAPTLGALEKALAGRQRNQDWCTIPIADRNTPAQSK